MADDAKKVKKGWTPKRADWRAGGAAEVFTQPHAVAQTCTLSRDSDRGLKNTLINVSASCSQNDATHKTERMEEVSFD